MSGLFGQELEFRQRGVELAFFHNEALQPRRAKLAFGIPYETLLGMLCYGNDNVAKASTFFVKLSQVDLERTSRYLAGFISLIASTCDLSSSDLQIRVGHKDAPMDFPRPSPARMLVWEFAAGLARDPALLLRLQKAAGADWFFMNVR